MQELEQLYHIHRDGLYRYLLGLCRDPVLAEELLQETFLQALLGLGRFRGESSVETWLFAIGRNLWLKHLRKQKDMVAYDQLQGYFASGTLEEAVHNRELLERIQKLMAQKDARANLVFSMRAKGYGYAEIAQKAKISENSARVLEYRIRAWLKKQLEEEET